MSVQIHRVSYSLQRVVHTSAATFATREGLLIGLTAGELTGWGEALPVPGWFHRDLDGVISAMDAWLESTEDDPDQRTDQTGPLPRHPVAAAAIDCARLDLQGRRTGRPIHQLLRRGDNAQTPEGEAEVSAANPEIQVNALIGAIPRADAVHRAMTAIEAGFAVIKMKVAADHITQDVERVGAVRRAIGPTARIRLDANQGWTVDEAPEAIKRLAEFDVEYLEEPCPSLPAIARMREGSPIPLYVDEQVSSPGNAHQVIVSGMADGLVLKPAALGPLGTGVDLAARAHKEGLGVTFTNVLDSGIGTTAAMHVALAAGTPLNACGFATGDLFSHTPAPPPVVINGRVRVPTTPGLGLTPTLSEDFLDTEP